MQEPTLAAAYRTLDVIPEGGIQDSEESRHLSMTKSEAALVIAKYHSKRIVEKIVTPYKGSKALVWEACHSLSHCPEELGVFVALESEYADFSDNTRRSYYGEEYCANLRRKIEQRIVAEAKAILDDDL